MRKIYEWVERGNGVLQQARERLQLVQRTKLDQKLDLLAQHGGDLPPGLLGWGVGGQRHIMELKVRGNVAMRPLLCKGPIDNDAEYTFLFWATERDDELVPRNAADRAESRRIEIIADPTKRRVYDDEDSNS